MQRSHFAIGLAKMYLNPLPAVGATKSAGSRTKLKGVEPNQKIELDSLLS